MLSSRTHHDLVFTLQSYKSLGTDTMFKVFRECHVSMGHIQIELFQKANILRSVTADSIVLARQFTCCFWDDRISEFTNWPTEAFQAVTAQVTAVTIRMYAIVRKGKQTKNA